MTPNAVLSARLTTESHRLRGKLELVLPPMLATGRRLMSHPGLRGIYPEYLIMTHTIIRASVPLMENALSVAQALPNDRVAVLLADYLEHHILEEQGHDDWLLDDLEFIGVPREQVLRRVPSPTVAALVGSQYYWMQHVHPVGLLGYIAMFECYPPMREDIDRVQAVTGYGPDAFRTMLLHADLDTNHGKDLDDLLDSLPLTERQRTIMGVSALSSVALMTQARQELLDRF